MKRIESVPRDNTNRARGARRALGILCAGIPLFAAGCAAFPHGWREAIDSNCAKSVSQFTRVQLHPDRYRGSLQAFGGDVEESRTSGRTLILRLFIRDPSGGYETSPDHSIVVVAPEGFDLPVLAGDKSVSVLGRVGGPVSGDLSFGPKVDGFTLQLTALRSAKGVWVKPGEEEAYASWRGCF